MSRHALGPWKWRSTDARNITEEDGWVAIPKEDYRRLQKSLKGINPEAVPDLLEGLRDFAGSTLYAHLDEEGREIWRPMVKRSRAAIAKATQD